MSEPVVDLMAALEASVAAAKAARQRPVHYDYEVELDGTVTHFPRTPVNNHDDPAPTLHAALPAAVRAIDERNGE